MSEIKVNYQLPWGRGEVFSTFTLIPKYFEYQKIVFVVKATFSRARRFY